MKSMSLTLSAALIGLAGIASAQDDALTAAIKARQAHMDLYAYNISVLGGMAQDKIAYDADMAQAAAGNIAALSQLDQSRYWPEGSDTMMDNTAALPEIWENFDDVMSKANDLAVAATAMDAAAGQGLDALKAAMGPLGGACGACHRTYRQRDE